MPKFELMKSIEAAPLNKRTGIPTGDPQVTIPYGAIIENVEQDRDFDKFTYLCQPYRCRHEIVKAATAPVAVPKPSPPASPDTPPLTSGTLCLVWQELQSSHYTARRAKVPGGWLVSIGVGGGDGVAFYPDPQHIWDGASLP
jgi:hypothetical protein